MTIAVFTKIEQKLRKTIVRYTRNKSFYPYLYKSYWHYLFHKMKLVVIPLAIIPLAQIQEQELDTK